MRILQDVKIRFSAIANAALAEWSQKVARRRRQVLDVGAETEELRESFAQHLLSFPNNEISPLQAHPRDVDF